MRVHRAQTSDDPKSVTARQAYRAFLKAQGHPHLLDKPLQFTSRDLLITITATAVVLAICTRLPPEFFFFPYIFSVFFAFFTILKPSPRRIAARILLLGVLLPLGSLLIDPWILTRPYFSNYYLGQQNMFGSERQYTSLAQLVLQAFVIYQFLALIVFIVPGARSGRESAFLVGTLTPGCVMAALVACDFTIDGYAIFKSNPAKLIAFLIILTPVPLLMSWSFFTAIRLANMRARRHATAAIRLAWGLTGVVVSIVLPYVLGRTAFWVMGRLPV